MMTDIEILNEDVAQTPIKCTGTVRDMSTMMSVDLLKSYVVQIAKKWVGTIEEPENKGAAIARFQRAVDGKAQGEPWCAAFVQYCAQAAYENAIDLEADEIGPSIGLWSSEHCRSIWEMSDKDLRKSYPSPGDVVIWAKFKNWDHLSSAGHCGIVLEVLENGEFLTIEGNVAEEGKEGVFVKTRNVQGSKSLFLVGFLEPFLW